MERIQRSFRVFFFALLATLTPTQIFAQSGTSSVQGTVADTSGAVIPDANVSLTNTATGVKVQAHTDNSGNYSFPTVQPGMYSVEITKEGFASYTVSRFNVTVGAHATQDAKLGVSSTTSVVVEAGGLANLIDPQSNDLGTVIGPESVNQLPLADRNYLQLGLLSGATQQVQGAAAGSITQTGHQDSGIAIAGLQPDFTMYVVNGLQTLGSRAGNTSLNLSVGAIDQFEVHYGFFMPDLGPNPGIVDVVTKSGTNRIHGEAFEFFRNDKMQARNFFSRKGDGTPIPVGPYQLNQFGFDFGGPILHDKLFYFVNYEGYRKTQSNPVTVTVPSAAMLTGDFSALSTPIYDPGTYNSATGQRTQFPGNKIPDARINPTIKGLLNYYASAPAFSSNNLSGTPNNVTNSDQFMGKIDWSINPKHQVFFQGNWLNSPVTNPGLFNGQGTAFPMDTELVNIGWNWMISSNKVNELRLGGIRDSVYSQGRSVDGLQNQLNITGTADPNGVPAINFTTGGLTGFGTSTGLIGNLDNIYQIHEGFNWLHGNHQIKMGAEIAYLRTIQSSANANARGVFNFNGQFTAQLRGVGQSNPTGPADNTGFSFADFLLGDLTQAQSIGMPRTHLRWTTAQPYIQDTWKVNSKLTINAAMSYYLATSPNPEGKDKNLVHGFDFATGKSTFAALGQMNPAVYPMTLTNLAPRFGITYAPDFFKNTLFRAGWGLYYTTQQAVNFQYAVVSQVISVNNAVSNTQPNPKYVLGVNAMPAVTVGQITQPQADAITGPIQYFSQTQRSPYISQWNADLQHTFASKYLLDLAYIGNASYRLPLNWNPFDCSAEGSPYCYNSNNPYFGKYDYMQEVDNIGFGNYNSLLVKFQRQFSHGLGILANYTYSKAMAASQEGSNGTLNQRRSCLPYCDYGPTTSDATHSFVVSTTAELPFGRGRMFGRNMNHGLDYLVGGWDIDAIVTLRSGTPFTVTTTNRTAWSPGQIRSNRYCSGHSALGNKNPRNNGITGAGGTTIQNYWLKPQGTNDAGACYVDPYVQAQAANNLPVKPGTTETPRAVFGNAAFDSDRGPGINNWNMGIHKVFPIYHEAKFILRGEFFNIFNHAQFSNPNSNVNAGANFGLITSTQRDARIIQVGGQIRF